MDLDGLVTVDERFVEVEDDGLALGGGQQRALVLDDALLGGLHGLGELLRLHGLEEVLADLLDGLGDVGRHVAADDGGNIEEEAGFLVGDLALGGVFSA